MSYHELYVWENDLELEPAEQLLQSTLGVQLEGHYSDFVGGDYSSYKSPDGSFQLSLQPNYVDEDGVPNEDTLPPQVLLLYVSGDQPNPLLAGQLTGLGMRLVKSSGGQ